MARDAHGDHGHDLEVTIHDEDVGGDPILVHAGPGTPIQTIIDRFYHDINASRQADDRLRCIGSGADVFAHAGLHLADYAESSCADLVWAFTRGTGGA